MNNQTHSVRNRPDRRVTRTVRALTRALIDLVAEKRYRAITIQDLLDRADVGRSTFYSHFRSKDDLLFRSFEWMLDSINLWVDGNRLVPVEELFHHVSASLGFHRALARAHMLDRLYETGTNHLAQRIAERLSAGPRRSTDFPVEVEARLQAGAAFALLRWWIDCNQPYPPGEMDRMFHQALHRNPGANHS